MKSKTTVKGYLGLLVGLSAAVFYLAYHGASTRATAQEQDQRPPEAETSQPPVPPPTRAPSERIDVEQAVPFPYDI